MSHTDSTGRPLAVDDTVMGTFGGSSSLTPYVVVGFTPKQIRVQALKRAQGVSGRWSKAPGDVLVRSSDQIALVETGDGRPLGELALT